jgi:hypothetical protein
MCRRNRLMAVVAVLFMGSSLAAQEGQTPPEPKEGAGAVKRDRATRQQVRDITRTDPATVAADMAQKLALDDAQKAQVQQLVADFQVMNRELRKQYRPSDESGARLQAIREELSAAREANDEAKQQQLLEELKVIRVKMDEAQQPLVEQADIAKNQLHNDLEKLMRGEQRQKFETYWESIQGRRNRELRDFARSPQALKALVERLPGLSSDQKSKLDGLFKAHFEESKGGRRVGAEADQANRKLYNDVLAQLTDTQREKLEQYLGGQGGRGGPGNRPGAKGANEKSTNEKVRRDKAKGDKGKDEPSPPSDGG